MKHSICTCIMAACSLLEWSSKSYADIFDYKVFEDKCVSIVSQFGIRSLANHTTALLTDFSDLAILDVLRGRDVALLRLACYFELKKRRPEWSDRALGMLLSGANEIDLFETEYSVLTEISISEPKKAAEIFAGSFGRENNIGALASGNLVLRHMSLECIQLLAERCLAELWPSMPSAMIVDEIERRKVLNGNGTLVKLEQEILKQLRDIPGRPQLVVVSYFNFTNDAETLNHIAALLNDATLSKIEVVLYLSSRSSLIAKNDLKLIENSSSPKLVKERIEELQRRFP